MKVQVRLFARYREAAGRDSLDLELPDGGTVERAWEAVARQLPALQPYRPFTLFALRNDYVGADHPLGDGDELCLFPPVSGGSHPVSSPADWIEITAEPLSERAVAQAVEHPGAGGIALFSGVVRDQTGGRRVKFLEYEAHAPMALAKMREIAVAIRGRWPATARVALVERDDRGLLAAPGSGLRRLPLRDRHPEGDGADLEEGALRGRRGMGGAAVAV